MTTSSNAGEGRAELFVADFYPQLGEYLAERHASGYDAVAARARFLIWLAQHVDKTAIRPPRADRVIGEIAVVQRRLLRELGREPTPEELAAELGTSPD